MASGNGISGLLNFKIFGGSMPPDPPRDWRLRRAPGLPPRTQISSYGHDSEDWHLSLFPLTLSKRDSLFLYSLY